MLIAVFAVVIIAAGGVAAAVMFTSGSNNTSEQSYETSEIRLTIYGNANGDDVIDSKDVETIQKIIDSNDADWKEKYYFADANHDGKITSEDIDVVNKIINKESTRMWYENVFSTLDTIAEGTNKHIDSYVNYPIGTKVGCEDKMMQILCALGCYDYLKAVSAGITNQYGDETYPGISSLPVMGAYNELDVQTLEQMYEDGIIDTVIMWSGGEAQNYIWEDAVNSGVADDISFVMVPCQGRTCVNGALMLAAMFGDQSLSDKYVNWYDKAMKQIDKIGDTIDKKKILVCKMFYTDTISSISAYNQYQPPALWFSEVLDFADNCAGKAGFTKLGSTEAVQAELEDYGITEMVVQTRPPSNERYELYNAWVEKKLNELFTTLPVYENQNIYTIEFDLMPFFGGPAGCYLLAAQLYPDEFSMEDAFKFTQEYLDNFQPISHNAEEGYTYTGDGYYPYEG